MQCPQCQHKLSPLKILSISGWTNATCPACNAKLNRPADLQRVLISIIGVGGMAVIALVGVEITGALTLPIFLAWGVWFFVITLLDARTVKLVVVRHKDDETKA